MGISFRLGPFTFYSSGRRRRKYPTCKICGKRTTLKVCRECQNAAKKLTQMIAPDITNGFHKLDSSDISLEKKKEICKAMLKDLKILKRYDRLLDIKIEGVSTTILRMRVRKKRRKIKKELKAIEKAKKNAS